MDTLIWPANDQLCTLLRRYYCGEAGLWAEILACVDQELMRRQLPVAPRHVRFRRTTDGYLVEVRSAEGFQV
ncbi:hypothetical protein [Chloroflexus sp. MS-G]|uniref:hypothetical protein n=1 Tax=Chloroflexus sp. MS-G TaxID=1521187 RepID=UPI0004DF68E9|nr:hypothetical protein [Chloroflexus sp. MS-G]